MILYDADKMASKGAESLAISVEEFLLKLRRPAAEEEILEAMKDENTSEVLEKLVKQGTICKKDLPHVDVLSEDNSVQVFWPKSLFDANVANMKETSDDSKRSGDSGTIATGQLPNTPSTPMQETGSTPMRSFVSRSSDSTSRSGLVARARAVYRTPFKTPRRVGLSTPRGRPAKAAPSSSSQEELEKKVDQLTEELKEVDAELEPLLEKYSEEDVQSYIDALHKYNEVKDAAQILMGKLAELQGVTVKKVHEDFGLTPED